MNIIKAGTLPNPPAPYWWVGTQITCPKCGCIFELQLGDMVHTSAERCPNGKTTGTILCPTQYCGFRPSFIKPKT